MLRATNMAALQLVLLSALIFAGPAASAQSINEVLTNAAAVISLPPERAAREIKVFVRGIVAAADPALKGRFFLQDSTGGVFVDNANGQRREPGAVVEVYGISTVGADSPVITATCV